MEGYTSPGLNIEELAGTLDTNRTYLAAYIKSTYHMSFREWIAGLRIEYAKRMLVQQPELTVSAISEASGFLSLSYFTKIFTDKEGCSPSKWRKNSSSAVLVYGESKKNRYKHYALQQVRLCTIKKREFGIMMM